MPPKGSADHAYHFAGFHPPYYTQVPDALFDEVMAHLTHAELLVTLYVLRRTFGFKKASDAISLSQICEGITTKDGRRLDEGTGLARSSAIRAVRGLEDKGVLVASRTPATQTTPAKVTTYTLNVVGGSMMKPRQDDDATTVGASSDPQETDSQETVTTESPSRDLAARLGDRIAVALRQPTRGEDWARTLRDRRMSDAELERLVQRALATWEAERNVTALTEVLKG